MHGRNFLRGLGQTPNPYHFFAVILLLLAACARYPAIPEVDKGASGEKRLKKQDSRLDRKTRMGLLRLKKSAREDYVIGVRDVLDIEVWQHPELTGKFEVPSNGLISFPLVGDVVVEGKLVAELEKELTRKLDGRFIINPQVRVNVADYKSKSVYVMGEVGGQGGAGVGRYPLQGRTTLLEILTQVGLSEKSGTECIVIRPKEKQDTQAASPTMPDQAGEGEVIQISIPELMAGDLVQNIELKNGDTIYVPPAKYYFVFGEVKSPGKYKLEGETTVLKAIATAGGTTDKAASIKRARILREEDGKKVRLSANPTDALAPGDTLIVPQSFF